MKWKKYMDLVETLSLKMLKYSLNGKCNSYLFQVRGNVSMIQRYIYIYIYEKQIFSIQNLHILQL